MDGGIGLIVYDPCPHRITILYKGREIQMMDYDLEDLDRDGDWVKLEGTRWLL